MTKKFLHTLLLLMTCLALLMPATGMAKWMQDGDMWYDGEGNSMTNDEYQSMMGSGHAPYCNGPGHCICGAESAPPPTPRIQPGRTSLTSAPAQRPSAAPGSPSFGRNAR